MMREEAQQKIMHCRVSGIQRDRRKEEEEESLPDGQHPKTLGQGSAATENVQHCMQILYLPIVA